MSSLNVWDAELYDNKLAFVSEFGKGVVDLLNPQAGERILDLGCGTGDLTNKIANKGAIVDGFDLSLNMIEKARQKFPEINFLIQNGETFRSDVKYDAIFSNAALHWMKGAENVVESVWLALREGGRFVAEFGGKGNVETLIRGITQVLLDDYGIKAEKHNPWYFPSVGEYSTLLEKQGFRVKYAVHFDRPTPLEDGDNGLIHWLTSFANDFFRDVNESQKAEAYLKVRELVRPYLFHDGVWYADYKRIRIVAEK